uniref:KTSC domain-containing protein n=1 Tax=Soboliphyme baturini TaxID=241478 RepID=A0A183JAJ9_9BILA
LNSVKQFNRQQISETQYWRHKVLAVAVDYPDYTFAVSDETSFITELKEVGLAESGMDVNAVVYGKDGYKYVMDPEVYDEFNEPSFRKFMKDVTEVYVLSSLPL